MCKKQKGLHNRIDKCMTKLIEALNREGYKTYGSCCGHGKYPMTIIMRDANTIKYDFISGKRIYRDKKYYKKDLTTSCESCQI